MAGIGFSLRKILNHDSFIRTIAAYMVAGIISGGPWLISVLGIIILAVLVLLLPGHNTVIAQFQTSITYLIATSLIYSGFAANSFSRYVADQIFLNKFEVVIPNLSGMMCFVTVLGGAFAFPVILFLFPDQSIIYRFCFMGTFVILSNIWVVITLLTGLKDYTLILKSFFLGYFIIVFLAYLFKTYGLDALMCCFLLGQIILLFILLMALYKEYPTNYIIDFHFLKKNSMYKILIVTGVIFNSGIWIDKFIFWYVSNTGYYVIGFLRASWIYDVPIFIAYLCSLPGMAVFLLLMETQFAEYYELFHEAIRRGKSLDYIMVTGEKMVQYAYDIVFSILKIQALTIIIVFQFGETILNFFHISILYNNLLYIAIIGTSLQVVLLAITNILYYINRLKDVFWLALAFLVLNIAFTLLSLNLGPYYYGFGFTLAAMCSSVYGLYLLNREFKDIEYKVIMLQ